MASSEEEVQIRIIPDNIIKSHRIVGFNRRNVIDGAVTAVIVAMLINLVPFVFKVQVIATLCLAGSLFIVCLIGIKGMSISECIVNIVISKSTKHKYHMKNIRFIDKRRSTRASADPKVINESIAEKAVRRSKELIQDVLEKRK